MGLALGQFDICSGGSVPLAGGGSTAGLPAIAARAATHNPGSQRPPLPSSVLPLAKVQSDGAPRQL